METELIIAYMILFFTLVAILLCYALHRVVENARKGQELDEPLEASKAQALPPKWSGELTWLVWLTGVTVVLLLVQVILGIPEHSLTLLADSAQGAADAVTYGLAAYVEHLKHSWGRKSMKPEVSEWADRGSALFSMAIIWATSIAVAVEAVFRALEPPNMHDVESFGVGLLVIAVLSIAGDLLLLLVYWCQGSDGQPEDETHCPRAEGEGQQTANKQGDGSGGAHAAEEQNLNMYGVFMHLLTDMVRNVVMLVLGVLARCRALQSPDMVDAICSVIICVMVSIGCFWLVAIAFPGLDCSCSCFRGKNEVPATSYGATSDA